MPTIQNKNGQNGHKNSKGAAESDEAIANGTAQLYETPDELFNAWERESK